ncbi:MAG: hypothetical protein IIC84_02155 [Chloroflexi bacterium]|nr:hypothetical protein [Chloroflexota bacterium]
MPKVEIHLMVERPDRFIADFVQTSVDRILVHYESKGDLAGMIARIKADGTEAGIVLNLKTAVNVASPFIKDISIVQLMSIATIGHYGEPFDKHVIEKIKTLKKNFPNVTIQIDGGISIESAKLVKEAGADNIVVGSAILKTTSPESAIKEFKRI